MLIFILTNIVSQPTLARNSPSSLTLESSKLKEHVLKLSNDFFPRSHRNPKNLNRCAEYILTHFKQAGADASIQEFSARGKKYKNVIGFFGNKTGERIVVGAHYDAMINTPGADDNASGVAGLIELAYLIGKEKMNTGIEMVAYVLEEPPFFDTEDMGSVYHTRLLHHEQVSVKCVIALEMIGYFNSEPGSQLYPIPALRLFYPSKGNFIGIVGPLGQRKIVKKLRD